MTKSGEFFSQHLRGSPVMVILRGVEPKVGVELATKAWQAGVSLVEVPIQSVRDGECLRAICDANGREGRPVGAGTITSVELAETAAELGAEFTVAPGWDPRIAERSAELGLAHLPGVATASEIQSVLKSGLRWMKAFPADALGERWFTGMRGPFPDIGLVATGGVHAGNAERLLDAGATAVALGSSFADMTPSAVTALSRWRRRR
ncbi:MAG: bifunctional 4-hydroxy-2-oxoglutarate aldolase/2-dehydro-3-deoxy-phosphogluconate aldolase [Propionibacteriaceae bacterium]